MTAEQMITWLLWTTLTLGVWNFLNLLGRIYYGAPWWPYPYLWSVISGAWARLIIWIR